MMELYNCYLGARIWELHVYVEVSEANIVHHQPHPQYMGLRRPRHGRGCQPAIDGGGAEH